MAKGSKWKAFLQKLNNPPNWIAILAYATTLIVCPLAVAMIAMDYGHNVYAIIAYVLCGLIFIYTTYVTVISLRKLYVKLGAVANKFSFTRNLYKNYEVQSIFFGACSFIFNVGYTVFLAVMAIRSDSTWYGALAVFHVLLAIARGGMLVQNSKDERRYKGDILALQKAKVGTYRYCGIMMLALTVALAVSVVQMAVDGAGLHIPTWAVYPFAAFALWRVVMAVIHFVKATKRDDLVVRAVRYINVVAALFSVLTLQTAVMAVLPLSFDPKVINTVTGVIVCVVSVALGAYMIAFASYIRERLSEQEHRAANECDRMGGYNRDGYAEEYGAPVPIQAVNADLPLSNEQKTEENVGEPSVENE